LGYSVLPPDSNELTYVMPEPIVMDQTEDRCLIHFEAKDNDGSKMRLDRAACKGIRMLGNGTLEADGKLIVNDGGGQELHIKFNEKYTIIFDCE